MKTLYQCQICGKISKNKESIIECENKGVPTAIVNIGDIIYFKDCVETPILYEERFSININSHSFISRTKLDASLFIDQLLKYKIANIKISGHSIEYILTGIPGESIDFSASDKFVDFYHYPTIKGNNLMQKVLEKYNK